MSRFACATARFAWACRSETCWRAYSKSASALFKIPGGLLDRGFIGAQIQDVERLAFANLVSGLEQPFLDVALHPAAHLDHVARVGLRRILGIDGDVRRGNLRHLDRRRRRGALVLRVGGAAGGGADGRENGCPDGWRKPITPHKWFDAAAPSEALCNSLLCQSWKIARYVTRRRRPLTCSGCPTMASDIDAMKALQRVLRFSVFVAVDEKGMPAKP